MVYSLTVPFVLLTATRRRLSLVRRTTDGNT